MSVERSLIMWKPFKYMVFFTRSRTKIIVLTVVLIWAAKNMAKFWTMGATYEKVGNETRVKSECGIVDGKIKYFTIEVSDTLII